MTSQQILKPPSQFEENYKKEGLIGSGTFGTVYKCRCKNTGDVYAIKVTDFSGEALQEVKVIHELPIHVNVVQYFNFWKDELPPKHHYSESSSLQSSSLVAVLCIPMELCLGHLRSWIESQTEITKEMHTKACAQLISGLEHIHRHNIIHRDLKPENVLIGLNGLTMKIGDFGVSTEIADILSHTPDVGNPLYRAPEQNNRHYDVAVDIYAMGLIFFELAWPQIQPARNGGNREVFRSTLRKLKDERKFPQGFEEKWGCQAQLVRKMIENCPRRRPNSCQLKKQLEENKDQNHYANENLTESRKVEKQSLFNCNCPSCLGNNFSNKQIENPLLEKKHNQCWNVLNPVPHFVGREMEITELHDFLSNRGNQILVISGMGGQGKTQLCRKWITQTNGEESLRIVWLQGESASNLACSLKNFAIFTNPELAESTEKGFDKLTEEVINLLEEENKVVWVIDNVDTEYKELETIASIILTRTKNSRIIITTRLRTLLTENAQYLILQTLSAKAAEDLIRNGINENLKDEDVKTLCEEMGYHALVLQLSIGFIRSQRIRTAGGKGFGIKAFLSKFNQNKKQLFDKTERLTLYEKNVFHHVNQFINFVQDGEENVATEILLILSLFRHDGVDFDFLLAISSVVPLLKEKDCKDRSITSDEVEKALNTLHSLSLIDASSLSAITIHPLIQETTRAIFLSDWIPVASSILNKVEISELSRNDLSHILKLWQIWSREDFLLRRELMNEKANEIYSALYETSQIQALVPFTGSHRKNILRAFGNSWGEKEVIRAELFYVEALMTVEEYEKGLIHLQTLQKNAIESLGKNDLLTIIIETEVALSLVKLNRAEEAVAMFESILSTSISLNGEVEARIKILESYAIALSSSKRGGEALQVYEEILQCEVKHLGNTHPSTLDTRRDIACWHFRNGNLEKAAEDFKSILELSRSVLEENPSDNLTTRGWEARVYLEMEDYDKARALLEGVLKDAEKVWGLTHLSTLTHRYNYAYCLLHLGKKEEAITELTDTLELEVKMLGENHSNVESRRELLHKARLHNN